MDLMATKCAIQTLLHDISRLHPDIRSAAQELFGEHYWAVMSPETMALQIAATPRNKRALVYAMTYPGRVSHAIEAAGRLSALIQTEKRHANVYAEDGLEAQPAVLASPASREEDGVSSTEK